MAKIRQRIATVLASVLILTAPTYAANQRSADFEQGNTLGLGLYGIAYDHAWGPFSAGITAITPPQYLNRPLNSSLDLGIRALGRFYQEEGLSAAILGAVTVNPGQVGERATLTPDLGISMGYDLREFEIPFALRLNLTLALHNQRLGYIDEYATAPNFFQRLGFGPNTSFEVAWMPTDHFELTVGGGNILGMRLKI